MHFETTFPERVIHLVIFVLAGVTAGALALLVIGRVLDGTGRPLIRPGVVAGLAAATVAAILVEQLYHALR